MSYRVWLLSLVLVWANVVALPALAQGSAPVIDDPAGLLGDGSAVRAAAARLAAEGADVVVITVEDAGTDPSAAEAYLDRRLNELDLADDADTLRGMQIVFFLAPRPGYQGIYYVSGYRDALDSVYRSISTETMQPLFTRGDYAEGMVVGIDAVTNTLDPPLPRAVPIVLIGVAVLAVLGGISLFVMRQRASANVRDAARQRVEEARRQAGVAIADLGRRVSAAREQAQFDAVSYGAQEAQRLAAIQQRGEQRFMEAQAAFDAAEERSRGATAGAPDRAAAASYDEATRLVAEATKPIAEAEQRRATLDRSPG